MCPDYFRQKPLSISVRSARARDDNENRTGARRGRALRGVRTGCTIRVLIDSNLGTASEHADPVQPLGRPDC